MMPLAEGSSIETLGETFTSFVRPMCFQSDEEFMWGIGTCFLLSVDGEVYAATAKHVIKKPGAEYQHVRITLPGVSLALPIQGVITPQCKGIENEEEIEDFVLLHVDHKGFEKHTGRTIPSLNIAMHRNSARALPIGTELVVAGYLGGEDRYDWDNMIVNDTLLIRNGSLAIHHMGYGMQTMEGSPSEFDFNGLCGSPVFAMLSNQPKLVGLVTRGSGSSGKLHFIEQEMIVAALRNPK
jgi:hypothetical protein